MASHFHSQKKSSQWPLRLYTIWPHYPSNLFSCSCLHAQSFAATLVSFMLFKHIWHNPTSGLRTVCSLCLNALHQIYELLTSSSPTSFVSDVTFLMRSHPDYLLKLQLTYPSQFWSPLLCSIFSPHFPDILYTLSIKYIYCLCNNVRFMRKGTIFSEISQMPRIESTIKCVLKYLIQALLNEYVLRKGSWYSFL